MPFFVRRLLWVGIPVLGLSCFLPSVLQSVHAGSAPSRLLRLIEIDPGHPHLSGLHSQMLPGIFDAVHIYAPLTPELTTHLAAFTSFNSRAKDPTHWAVRLFAAPSFLDEFTKETPGQIVALSGRNEKKIDYILAALRAGQNVFADKPWIINDAEFPKLQAALELAQQRRLVTYDWMTLRGNAAYQLQRDLIQDAEVFGGPATGSEEHPAVRLQNLHALLKYANGVPQLRPPSFLDIRQQGEGMADVGTHLADLVQWTLFPSDSIAFPTDIKMLSAQHSALTITAQQFKRLTGIEAFPEYLRPAVANQQLQYVANGSCSYALRGVHVQLKVEWEFEAPPRASDSYLASYQGTRSTIELRAGASEHYVPEIYITPMSGTLAAATFQASLERSIQLLQKKYAGLSVQKEGSRFHVLLPPADRSGDDLQNIFKQFATYVRDPTSFPQSEATNLLAKYYVTTKAVAMANGRR